MPDCGWAQTGTKLAFHVSQASLRLMQLGSLLSLLSTLCLLALVLIPCQKEPEILLFNTHGRALFPASFPNMYISSWESFAVI